MLPSPYYYRTTALSLISIACLVVAGVAWQQREHVASLELQIQMESRPANSEDSRSSQSIGRPTESIFLRPTIAVPLALLAIFAGSLLLARGNSQRPENKQDNAKRLDTEPSDSIDASTARLLAYQRSLAQTSDRALRSEFAAKLSHDLRNPLAGIQMSLSNLMSEGQDSDLRERLELVHSESVRVADLLGKAVESSRGTPEPLEEVELGPLVESLLELIAFQTAAHIKIRHSIQEGLYFRLPPQRFQHSLAGLILNAAEAIGESEGSIQVEVVMGDNHLRVSVIDTGPGFPEELLLGASRQGKPELGLATVQRFAREMGGKLEISNQSSGVNSSGGRATILLPSGTHHG